MAVTTYGTDTAATVGRGVPNTWSPGSDGGNWAQSRGNQTLLAAASQLVLTYNNSTVTGIMTYTSQTPADTEVLVNAQQTGASDIVGAVVRFKDSNNFYEAVIGNASNTFEIRRDLASTFSTIGSASFTVTAGTKYTIRFQALGISLRAKIWATSGSEPGSWTITTTDKNLAAGLFGVAGAPQLGNSTMYDTFSATNALTVPHQIISSGYGGVFN